jgi:hypothetical protein
VRAVSFNHVSISSIDVEESVRCRRATLYLAR